MTRSRGTETRLCPLAATGQRRGLEEKLELAAAKRRIKQLETELAVARNVIEVFLAGVEPAGCTSAA